MEPYLARVSDLRSNISEEHSSVDDVTISKRLKKLRQEISEIVFMNTDYSTREFHVASDTNMRNNQRLRLEEIEAELAVLQRRAAA